MSFLLGLLIVVHVLVCLLLIGVVLIQRGEGGSLMSAFASQSQTVFGSQAINVFVKTTWVLGSLFFLLSITLAIAFGQRLGGGGTVLSDTDRPAATSAPVSAASAASAASAPASAPASGASAPVSAAASAPVASAAKPASSPAPKASVAKPAASAASAAASAPAPASVAKPASAASTP